MVGFSDDGDLRIADPDLLSRLDRERWSPSSSKSMTKCPANWAIGKVLEHKPDPFDPAPVGTAVHLVLELLYGLPHHDRTQAKTLGLIARLPTDFRDDLAASDITLPSDDVELARWLAVVTERTLPLFDVEDPADVLVVGRERGLDTATIDGVPFIGYIDRTDIVRDAEGKPVGVGVRDYKSAVKGAKSDWARRNFGDDHGDQGRLYALALEDLDGRRPDEVSIIYTATGESYTVTTDRASMNRVRREFRSSWEEMKASAASGRYRATASKLCGWCPLATVCPNAAEAGVNEPKVDLARTGERYRIGLLAPPLPDRRPLPHTTSQVPEPTADSDQEVNDMSLFANISQVWTESTTDGTLNGGSYAATAAFGLTTSAVEHLHRAGQPLTGTNVRALTGTFAHIVETVQSDLSARASLQDGLHTRLRGALHTAIDTLPIPFGADQAAWEEWVEQVTRRVNAIAKTAQTLWLNSPGEAPWTALAVASKHSDAA